MSLLIYSPRCKHSMEVIDYVNKHPQLNSLCIIIILIPRVFHRHTVTRLRRVPTMLTKNGKILVGNEIKNWLDSLLPNKEVTNCGFGGGCSMTTLDGEDNEADMFSLDNYGQSLQPAMSRELEEKINRDVSKGVAYSEQI